MMVRQQTHQHAGVAPKFVQIPQDFFATKMEISALPVSFQFAKSSTA